MTQDIRFIGRAQRQDMVVIRYADGQRTRAYRNRAVKAIRAAVNRNFRKFLAALDLE